MNLKAPNPALAEFGGMPDSSRIWIFGVSRSLDPGEEVLLLERVDTFVAQWAAHGQPMAARRAWSEGRFLFVAVDDNVIPPSGCSMDALVRELRGVETELQLQIVGNAPIWLRGPGGEPTRVTRQQFRDMAREAAVDLDSRVFDLSLTRLGDLRAGRFEGPVRDHWHKRLLE